MDAKEEDREIRSEIALLAEEWRAIARAMPHWHVDRSGDEIVLRQSPHGQPLATLHGEWAPNLARFFRSHGPDGRLHARRAPLAHRRLRRLDRHPQHGRQPVRLAPLEGAEGALPAVLITLWANHLHL